MKQKLLFVLMAALLCSLTLPAAEKKNLPEGGGEPGKVYMEYCKAMEAGDLAALKKLVIAEEAKMIDTPEFKQAFPIMKSMRIREIKITGGTTDGKNAELIATGKDPSGKPSKGSVTLMMENKQWKVVEDAWATSLN